jgi:hypothetical protein
MMVTTALYRASWSKLAWHSALRHAQNRKPKVRCLPQMGPNNRLQATANSLVSLLGGVHTRSLQKVSLPYYTHNPRWYTC